VISGRCSAGKGRGRPAEHFTVLKLADAAIGRRISLAPAGGRSQPYNLGLQPLFSAGVLERVKMEHLQPIRVAHEEVANAFEPLSRAARTARLVPRRNRKPWNRRRGLQQFEEAPGLLRISALSQRFGPVSLFHGGSINPDSFQLHRDLGASPEPSTGEYPRQNPGHRGTWVRPSTESRRSYGIGLAPPPGPGPVRGKAQA